MGSSAVTVEQKHQAGTRWSWKLLGAHQVLSGFLLLRQNPMTKVSVWRKGFLGLHLHSEAHHQRKSRQELKQDQRKSRQGLKQDRNLEAGVQRPWRAAAFLSCSACFHMEARTTSSGMAPSAVGWALNH